MNAPDNWPVCWQDWYEERCGILEYDGGMEKENAEIMAIHLTVIEAARFNVILPVPEAE